MPISDVGCPGLLFTAEAASGFFEQVTKPSSCLLTSDLARCHVENELFPIVDRQFPVRQKAVLLQEHKTRSESGAFVAIKERMIAGNVKQIGSCNLERIGNEGLTHHGCVRRGYG